MTIYVLTSGEYSSYDVDGVTDDLHVAETWAASKESAWTDRGYEAFDEFTQIPATHKVQWTASAVLNALTGEPDGRQKGAERITLRSATDQPKDDKDSARFAKAHQPMYAESAVPARLFVEIKSRHDSEEAALKRLGEFRAEVWGAWVEMNGPNLLADGHNIFWKWPSTIEGWITDGSS